MKKAISIFLSVLLLLPCLMLSASAESYVSNGWTSIFDGKKLTDNFKGSSITDAISKIEPGDDLTINITIKNMDSTKNDWYMSNEVLKSLEESKASAKNGAYSYKLTYTNPAGQVTTFFDSDTVGGDSGNIKTETSGLNGYFYVDRLDSSKSGLVTLKVKLDGETDGNAYQNTLAQFKINFAVEKPKSDVVYYGPKTGDTFTVYMWAAVFGVSMLSLAVVLGLGSRRKKGAKA